MTSVARTLVDLTDVVTCDELRAAFMRARELGILGIDAVAASAARVELAPVARDELRGDGRVRRLTPLL